MNEEEERTRGSRREEKVLASRSFNKALKRSEELELIFI